MMFKVREGRKRAVSKRSHLQLKLVKSAEVNLRQRHSRKHYFQKSSDFRVWQLTLPLIVTNFSVWQLTLPYILQQT